jgi:NOL1/NOP2/fmu family ribosome biogenesis protein
VPLDPAWQVDEPEFEGIHGYRFLPSRVKGEGFFIALLRKDEETPPVHFPKFKTRLQKSAKLPADWIMQPEAMKFFQHQDQLKFIPSRWEPEILYLFSTINIIKAGTTAGQLIRNEILPDHELAMSVHLHPDAFPRTELSAREALNYLAREPFHLKPNGTSWQLVTFRGTPLGFIKNLESRFNNYYPKAWRLRMQPGTPGRLWHEQG